MELPGDEDTDVGSVGGDGDGRRMQNAQRGECGRDLPNAGGAGRIAGKRPALTARRTRCLFLTATVIPRVRAPPPQPPPTMRMTLTTSFGLSLRLCKHNSIDIFCDTGARLCGKAGEGPACDTPLSELPAAQNTCMCENNTASTQAPVRGGLGEFPARGKLSIC